MLSLDCVEQVAAHRLGGSGSSYVLFLAIPCLAAVARPYMEDLPNGSKGMIAATIACGC